MKCCRCLSYGFAILFPAIASASIQPSDLLTAYGFNSLSSTYTGAGQTIAIYSSSYYGTLQSDVNAFSNAYMNGQSTTISIVGTDGTNYTGKLGSASAELSLDVEYAHLIAPQAKIVVVYSPTISLAAQYAAQSLGASVVSISYGSWESSNSDANITAADKRYKIADGLNTAVLSAAGDSSNLDYPASSPYVMGVGGSNLTVTSSGKRSTEVGWSSGGGGQSRFANEPSWQYGVQQTGYRQGPDVSIAGGSASSMPVYTGAQSDGFGYYYGSSIATPIWAGIIALADQGRATNGLDPLGTTDLLTLLYGLAANPTTYSKAFYDIATGTNGQGVSAGTGFDMLTGLGSPNVSYLVPYLATAVVPEPGVIVVASSFGLLMRRRRKI